MSPEIPTTMTLWVEAGAPWSPVKVPESKSVAARALILAYIYRYKDGREIKLSGLPDCDDTRELSSALDSLRDANDGKEFRKYNLGLGGTSLRFFLALVASLPGFKGEVDCSEGLRHRPIKSLLDALREAGAEIEGEEPPLTVTGKQLEEPGWFVPVSQSSQFVSALMMSSLLWKKPYVGTGFDTVSASYIDMTRNVMDRMESATEFKVEGDWSAASFFYELALMVPGKEICLEGLCRPEDSVQGDSACQKIFEKVGVQSWWEDSDEGEPILHIKGGMSQIARWSGSGWGMQFDMNGTPDLVPPLAVGLCMAGIPFRLLDVAHLRFKESDRIATLTEELSKVGYRLSFDGRSLSWDGKASPIQKDFGIPVFNSHGDHRIAMAFAMTAARYGQIKIEGAGVVTKSFPDFYASIANIGIFL